MKTDSYLKALTRIVWAYIFLFLDVSLYSGPTNIGLLPNWAGWLLILTVLPEMEKKERSAVLLRPVVMLLGIWEAVCWIAVLFTGNSISLSFPLVQLICSVLTLYFHFQFFTNLASIAAAHDLPEYSRQMLYVRTVSTIYSAVIDVFFWFYPLDSVSGTIQIFLVITALCIILWMALTLFPFRKAEKRQF